MSRRREGEGLVVATNGNIRRRSSKEAGHEWCVTYLTFYYSA